MIKTETLADGRVRTYSDAGFRIRQIETGIIYDNAVDVLPCRYTYEETDNPVEIDDEHIPAWDVTQAEYIREGDRVSRDGVIYRCISGHYAAWNKQPPNDEYWEEVSI